ncbi:MAG: M20 family metallo-hydrolase [Flavobacteriales bacterium]|nr:M20 family metallo-hydrolase [Flavobacteriales bacterium]MCB9449485.1 M20 family metallo-hydrolase [Flavobacteriales bacterium]
MDQTTLVKDAVELLKGLISIESLSRKEENTAQYLAEFFEGNGMRIHRKLNNVWSFNLNFDPSKPTILLNSHHDTVKPNSGYSMDPFTPVVKDGKLFGLGSNDAGGCLVSLIAAFRHYYDMDNLRYNLVVAATAEEEVSGHNGLECVFPELSNVEFAIIGEPTQMHLAIAEKGLMVLDCVAHGKSGHAAREEGENAIYIAMNDIAWFKDYKFPKVSDMLGPIKMTTTVIHAGSQHNVVPDRCEFTVDIRITEQYKNQEILDVIKENVKSVVYPRSVRLNSSFIPKEHPIVQAGIKLGRDTYGSPTTSDQAIIDVPSLKCGPGDSARSHTADEYVKLSEIEEGIRLYIAMLDQLVL